MSRPFKFRAWDKDTQCYFYDIAIYPDNVVGIQRHNIESEILKAEYGATHWTELGENAIIEQYTGLKDQNGKEIYDGDIVKTTDIVTFYGEVFPVGVVEFVQTAFWIFNAPFGRHTHGQALLNYWENELEVIGNIHENPELIGGEDGRDK